MKAIILAAGRGLRFNRCHGPGKRIPKCLISIRGDDTILDYNLEHLLSEPSITEVVIITGSRSGCINEHLANRYPSNRRLRAIFNPDYRRNVVLSLRCAFNDLDPRTNLLILNGDTRFKKPLFQKVSEVARRTRNTVMLFGAKTKQFNEDDMRVITRYNRLISVGKFIPNADAVSAGAILLRGEGVAQYRNATFHENAASMRLHHALLQTISNGGYPVRFCDIGSRQWVEVDTVHDLKCL